MAVWSLFSKGQTCITLNFQYILSLNARSHINSMHRALLYLQLISSQGDNFFFLEKSSSCQGQKRKENKLLDCLLNIWLLQHLQTYKQSEKDGLLAFSCHIHSQASILTITDLRRYQIKLYNFNKENRVWLMKLFLFFGISCTEHYILQVLCMVTLLLQERLHEAIKVTCLNNRTSPFNRLMKPALLFI